MLLYEVKLKKPYLIRVIASNENCNYSQLHGHPKEKVFEDLIPTLKEKATK